MHLVRGTSDHLPLNACHTRRGIAAGADRLGIVKFNYLTIIDVCTKCPLNCIYVGPQRVGRNLNAIRKPLGNIRHERHGIVARPLANAISRDKLGIWIERDE